LLDARDSLSFPTTSNSLPLASCTCELATSKTAKISTGSSARAAVFAWFVPVMAVIRELYYLSVMARS
jgi:hypothetical protein